MEKAAQQALDESVVLVKGALQRAQSLEVLRHSSHAACITINSPRFTGYMIAATSQNRPVDEAFLKILQERLLHFLKDAGENPIDDESTLQLNLRQVEFQDWALEYADFLAQSTVGEDQVSMAFFPNAKTRVELEPSAAEDMLQIELSELRDNVPVEFDLYIYMPENQKFLRYIPTGRIFFGDQRSRLLNSGVAKMHLRKDNIAGVKKYRVQNFLNDKIDEFGSMKKLKTGPES
jgi:hypothetical protein